MIPGVWMGLWIFFERYLLVQSGKVVGLERCMRYGVG
jgi:hypothetical protein